MAPLQKRALPAFIIGIVMSAILIPIFIIEGPTKFHDDQGIRLLVYGVFVGGMLTYGLLLLIARLRRTKTAIIFDERDLSITRRAKQAHLFAVLISLGIWCIALTEVYWDESQIPIVFLYLIFMSSLIVNILAQAAGILIGYWRECPNDKCC